METQNQNRRGEQEAQEFSGLSRPAPPVLLVSQGPLGLLSVLARPLPVRGPATSSSQALSRPCGPVQLDSVQGPGDASQDC